MAFPECFVFGPFELDSASFRLSRDGAPIRLQPKALEMLVLLVRAGGALVTREDIRSALWPDVIVSEQSLRQVARKLREALGEHGCWLETVPRKGHRFLGPVTRRERPGGAAPARIALPAERDGFVGREDDLQRLGAALDEGGTLLTVLGPGGVGKTRLVVHYAWAHRDEWPGGVWFCDLSEARSVAGIVQAVAGALGLGLGREDPIEQIGHVLARRGRCLVILDNFEQVVEHAAATVGRWLDRGITGRFLVTSRQRLDLASEQSWLLAPLGQADAERLFVRRARMLRPDSGPSAEDDAAIESLVATLDRLPLAIELAAARCALMSPRGILDRLKDRFALLGGPRADRQGTLRATLDWSWDLLDSAERTVLAQLSVFERGWTVDAAEAVLEVSERPALDLLQGLVDKSLVRTAAGGRLELLVSVQEYAAARLAERGPEAVLAAEQRHGRFFAARPSPEDLDNVLAACRRAVARGDGEIAAGTALAAGEVLRIRGPFRVWAEWTELAATVPGPWVGALLIAAGRARAASGQFDVARRHLEAGLSLAAGDPRVAARAELGLGIVDRAQGRVDAARERLESALGQARAIGDAPTVCEALRVLGGVEVEQGRIEAALARYREALDEVRASGRHDEEGMVLSNLGAIYVDIGRLDEASACFEAALRAHREKGNRGREGAVLTNLGILRLKQGRYAESEACTVAALAIDREVGHRRGEALGLGNLGTVYVSQGRVAEARAHFTAALDLCGELGSVRQVGVNLGNLASISVLQGRWDEAERCATEALAAATEVKNAMGGAAALFELGAVHRHHGRLDEAREAWLGALEGRRQARSAIGQAECLASLAGLLSDEALADQAVAMATPYPSLAAVVAAERAVLRSRAGRWDEALADLPSAASLADVELLARCRVAPAVALVYARAGRWALARTALDEAEGLARALEIGPTSQIGTRIAEVRVLLARHAGSPSQQ